MTKAFGIGLLGVVVFLSGCATMFSGTTQQVNFSSTPSGAKLFVDNQELATPATLTLKRKDRPRVTSQKEGYKDQVLDLTIHGTDINSTTWLNFFNLGYGFIVDWATGAFWEFRDNNHVVLERARSLD